MWAVLPYSSKCNCVRDIIIIFHGSFLDPFDILGQITKQIRVPYLTWVSEYRSYHRYIQMYYNNYLKCLCPTQSCMYTVTCSGHSFVLSFVICRVAVREKSSVIIQ